MNETTKTRLPTFWGWVITLMIVLVVFGVAGIGEPESATTTAPPTQDVEHVVPNPEPVNVPDPAPELEEEFEPDPRDIADLAMIMSWQQQSQEDQEIVCLAWTVDREAALDQFMVGASGMENVPDHVVERAASEFFDGKC